MTEGSASSERRVALRRSMDIPVWVEKLPSQLGQPSLVSARTRDVSYRGAFLWAPAIFDVGQRLRLEMVVTPDGEQIHGLKICCDAEVVRLQPAKPPERSSGMGVRILSFDTPKPVFAQPI
jgi:PilZ domain